VSHQFTETKNKKKMSNPSFKKPVNKFRDKRYTQAPVDIFTEKERAFMHDTSNRTSFVKMILEKFNNREMMPQDIVNEARVYFKQRYINDRKNGIERKSHWLNSASTALSKIKKEIKTLKLAPWAYCSEIRLEKRELNVLDRFNHRRLEENSTNIESISGKQVLLTLYKLIDSDCPFEVGIGLAGLSGRRFCEIVLTGRFNESMRPMTHRYPSMWSYVTGFAKQKKHDKYAVRSREVPLLIKQERFSKCIKFVRSHLPAATKQQASELYEHKFLEITHKYLHPLHVKKTHDLRKVFVLIAHNLFNENNASIPNFASFVLGHKRSVSGRILTYLNTRVHDLPDLSWVLSESKSGLSSAHPESDLFQRPDKTFGIYSPNSSDGEPEDDKERQEKTPKELMPPPAPKKVIARLSTPVVVAGATRTKYSAKQIARAFT
jgi:hypothetical protein